MANRQHQLRQDPPPIKIYIQTIQNICHIPNLHCLLQHVQYIIWYY